MRQDTREPSPEASGAGQGTFSVEDFFSKLEVAFTSLQSDLRKISRPLMSATKSAKLGSVKKLQESSRTIASLLTIAVEKANNANVAANSFKSAYIDGQAYLDELRAAAEKAGLDGVKCGDRRVTSNPITALVEPNNYSLKVGRKRWDCLRPSAVAKELQKARSRAKGSSESAAFLEALFHAHSVLTQGRHELSHSLDDIYRVATLLPQVRRDYTLDEFHADIVSLDDIGPHRTKSGHNIEFYADTGGKAGQGFRMTRADGSQKLYFGIAFEREG